MAKDALSKILSCEDEAKQIIENARALAVRVSSEIISAEGEKFKAEEKQKREDAYKNIEQCRKEWQSKSEITRANAQKEATIIKQRLEKNKNFFTELLVNHILGKGGK